MIVIALTDIHGKVGSLSQFAEALTEADVVLLTGDLTNFGGAEDAREVVEAVRQHNERVFAVHGNCDQPELADWLTEEGISLHAKHRVVNGVGFLGLGGSLPAPGRTPSEYDEENLARFLQQATDGLDADIPWVLASHQPPANTALDRVRSGNHVGSSAVREFIETQQPAICFTGHIHEAAGTDAIGPTNLVNPGPAGNGGYAHATIDTELNRAEIRRT